MRSASRPIELLDECIGTIPTSLRRFLHAAGMRVGWLAWARLVVVLVSFSACATSGGATRARDVRLGSNQALVTQAELQQDLERFTGEFLSRVSDAGDELVRAMSSSDRERALQQLLLYESTALDIATDPLPEIALLDMSVFIGLSRGVFARYWIRELGEASRPLLLALRESEDQLAKVAAKVLSPEQQQQLRALIDDWLAANPDRIRVEPLRFGEFSELVGRISSARAAETRGLFGAVRSATLAADEMLLLGERARFLATRIPFPLRLQARIGASEVSSDMTARIAEMKQSLAQLGEVHPVVRDVKSVVAESRRAARDARDGLDTAERLLARVPPPEEIHRILGTVERINDNVPRVLDRAQTVLAQLNTLMPRDPTAATRALGTLEERADGLMRRAVLYLIVVGAAWSVLFWGAYCAGKLWLVRRARHGAAGERPPLDRFAQQAP